MNAAPVRVGIVGCGDAAQRFHLPVLARLPGVEVVALVEPDAARLEQARAFAPRAALAPDAAALAARKDVDAVIVCAPSGLHAAIAESVLAARKHLYLEKPLATDLADGRRVLAVWRAAGVVGMIGFTLRFYPPYRAVRRAIARGRLGELVAVRTALANPEIPHDWRGRRAAGGGVLLDLGSHHLDLLRYLFGREIVAVRGVLASRVGEDDTAWLQVELAGALQAQVFLALAAVREDRVEVYGRAGKLSVDAHLAVRPEVIHPWLVRARLTRLGGELRNFLSSPYVLGPLFSLDRQTNHGRALARFVAAVRQGRQPRPSLADGFQSLAAVLAAEESARTGRRVALAELTP